MDGKTKTELKHYVNSLSDEDLVAAYRIFNGEYYKRLEEKEITITANQVKDILMAINGACYKVLNKAQPSGDFPFQG